MSARRLIAVLCAVAFLAGCGAGRRSTVVEFATSGALPVDPSFIVGRLDNGMRYFIRENAKPANRAAIWLAVNAGSIQEDDDQQGLAHFVEHMAFNGTEHFAKHEIVDYLERIGMRFGPDVNAYTSFDETVYTLEVPTDDAEIIETAFLILDDWAGAVSFEGEEIDKERGVVLEEWRLGRGADARVRDTQFPIIFHGSRYAERLPIGKKEILESAPYDATRRFYRDWYRPDLMAVIAVGDFDAGEIERRIRTQFADLRAPESPRPRATFTVPEHDETLTTIVTDPELTRTSVAVLHKLGKRPQGTAEDYRRLVVEALYHGMLNDRLDELRQSSDPPFLFAYSDSGGFVRSADVHVQGAAVREGELQRGLEALLTEIERVARHGFTAGELERRKKDLLRDYEQSYRERDKRQSSGFAGETLRHFLEGESMPGIAHELELVRAFLPAITLGELNALARETLSDENRVIAVSAPDKTAGSLPGEADILAMFDDVKRRQIEPYVDEVLDGPLVAQTPTPGTIVEERFVEELGVTEWRLSNGVFVALKPTDFKNDEIRLTSVSLGGDSLVPDERYVSADFCTSLIRASGVGEFSRIQLEKALAGKVAEARPYVGELEEGIDAECSPDDVETMMQLIYLYFTAPRIDDEAVAGWFARTREAVTNRLLRPETVFGDRMSETLSQGHLRRRPVSLEMLDEIDVEAAFEIYRDRFADAGDFRFVIVGNFDVDAMRPLVRTWLGGLPATGREETWRDVGVREPGGVVEVDVRKGLEPKSRVSIRLFNDATWTRQAEHDMRTLASALRIRLREVLREDLGGTYGVQVWGDISRRPRERAAMGVSFGCAPENVESLTAAVFEQLHVLREELVDDDLVTKLRETQAREYETALERNRVWLRSLMRHYTYGTDPRLILEYDELVDSVSAERIRDAARRYIDTERYVIGRLNPESEAGEAK